MDTNTVMLHYACGHKMPFVLRPDQRDEPRRTAQINCESGRNCPECRAAARRAGLTPNGNEPVQLQYRCGHTTRYDLWESERHEPQRTRRLEWEARRDCPDCRAAAERARLRRLDEEQELHDRLYDLAFRLCDGWEEMEAVEHAGQNNPRWLENFIHTRLVNGATVEGVNGKIYDLATLPAPLTLHRLRIVQGTADSVD